MPAIGTSSRPSAASPTRCVRTESRYAALSGIAPAILRMPSSAAFASEAAMVRIRPRSATSDSDTSIASSVPMQSSATVTPSGAATRTRSSSPSP